MEKPIDCLDPHSLQSISPPIVQFCHLCNKPFTNESARHRHVRYCTTRTRSRPRSCRACSAAKVRCSFDSPCSRCHKKAIQCIYHDTSTFSRQPHLSKSNSTASNVSIPRSKIHNSPNGSLELFVRRDDEADPADALIPTRDAGTLMARNPSSYDHLQLPDLSLQFPETLTFDAPFEFNDAALGQERLPPDALVVINGNSVGEVEGWCAWTRHGVSLSVVTESSQARPNAKLQFASLRLEQSCASYNADLIVQSWRAFPTMMLRKETLPWFIHPLSQRQSSSFEADVPLPKAISNCMWIAQIFALRTPETRQFLWSTVEAEYRRCVADMSCLPRHDALAGLQACMMYLIMCIIDHSPDNEGHGQALLQALFDLCMYLKTQCGGSLNDSEISNPSSSWEEWIFAESRRRLANLWLLVGIVVCVKAGLPCDPSESYRKIPLPAPKSLWEASTQSAWEVEYDANRMLQMSGLVYLGDLVDLQRSDYTPSNARKLDVWNAGVDNLGSLLNLVGSMV